MTDIIDISDFDYDLPDERIARFPAGERDSSRLLVWRPERRRQDGRTAIPDCGVAKCEEPAGYPNISETVFRDIGSFLPQGSLLVFNNTRVVRARLVMHRPTLAGSPNPGARVEVLCLEPTDPADYERAFAAKGGCEWSCIVGNLKKWKSGAVEIPFTHNGGEYVLQAWRTDASGDDTNNANSGAEQIVRFTWGVDLTFGELLELLGRVPIPPYLGRDSEQIDNTRYQTVYATVEGSVAAPTAGLHFTPELIERLGSAGIDTESVTLHVGAGTFLPVKTENALDHAMHTEHFEITLATVEHLLAGMGKVIAVGTTSVRTLESLAALGWRISRTGAPETERPVGQFELYDVPVEFDGHAALETLAGHMRAHGLDKISASTRIMITPAGFRFRITDGIITNFHQPKSTLLLLIAAFTGEGEWRRIYDYALVHGFRFLSYGDSSLLLRRDL